MADKFVASLLSISCSILPNLRKSRFLLADWVYKLTAANEYENAYGIQVVKDEIDEIQMILKVYEIFFR